MNDDPTPKLCECGCGAPATLATYNAPKRAVTKGKPLRFIHGHNAKTRVLTATDYTVEDRGYQTPCWIWKHCKGNASGHGKVTIRKVKMWAHRAMWQQTYGSLPPHGLELDHLCQNPSCIRPEHLEAVTHAENVRRGRQTKMTGELRDQILALRSSGMSHPLIASEVGIGKSTVARVCSGRHWITHDSPA